MAELPGQLSQCGSELTSISPEREGAAEPIRHSPQPRGIFLSPSLFLPSFSRGSCFYSLFISTKPFFFFFFLALSHSPLLLLCFLQRQVSRRRVSSLTNQRHSLVASSPLVLHLYPPLLFAILPYPLLSPSPILLPFYTLFRLSFSSVTSQSRFSADYQLISRRWLTTFSRALIKGPFIPQFIT